MTLSLHPPETPRSSRPVAFLDLAALHDPLRAELDDAWRSALTTSSFIGRVERFEDRWAEFCGVDHAIGVGNGTDALELVLAALRIGPGDEVIIPANTFVATAEAVANVGAQPTFVDVDPDTLLVGAEQIAAAVTPRTAAVIVVHLYGQIPDMDAIMATAAAAGIAVVEDAAQAHGAEFRGRRAGSFGNASTFSFYPGKNLGALGDGGAVVTNDPALARCVRTMANHGRADHHLHTIVGRNSRLDSLQAQFLDIKLPHLDAWNAARKRVHAQYSEAFDGSSVQMVGTVPGSQSVHHLEVVRVDDRDGLRRYLAECGIESGIHYATPCHLQPAFEGTSSVTLPVAEEAARRQLSIPMHPTMRDHDVEAVVTAVLEHTEREANT